MNSLHSLIVLFSFLTLPLLNGCGYHLRGSGDALPPEAESIALIPFENRTPEAELDPLLALSLSAEFSRTKRLAARSAGEADLLLEGVLIQLTNKPVSFTSTDVATDYRLEVTADVTLRWRESGEVLWKGKGLKEIMDYQAVPGDIAGTEANRAEARGALADELAELIFERVFEGF